MKILVVDSLRGHLSMAKKILGFEGFEVITTQRGEEALMLLTQNPEIKLAIVDLDLEGQMQGPDLVKKIRELVPSVVWLMTGSSYHKIIPDLKKFLVKPFSSQDLIKAVKQTLEAQK